MSGEYREMHGRRREALNAEQASQETLGFGLAFIGGAVVVSSEVSELAAIPMAIGGAYLVLRGLGRIIKNKRIQQEESKNLDTYKEFEQIISFNNLD